MLMVIYISLIKARTKNYKERKQRKKVIQVCADKLQLKLSLLIKELLKRSVSQNGNTGSTFLSLSVAGLKGMK